MVAIALDNQIYELKFGIKSLNLIYNFSKHYEKQNILFALAFENNKLNNIKVSEYYSYALGKYGYDIIQEKLQQAKEEALKGYLDFNKDIYEELYALSVGEMGISLHDFELMTPYEISLAYKGFIQKQELQTNCIVLALQQAKNKNVTNISLLSTSEQINRISPQERELTLKQLKIFD